MTQKGEIRKILVIDDDPTVVKLAEGILKSKGYEVSTALEAADGLEKAMKEGPNLIILDVMMPVINGFNICRLMKSEEDHQKIPIILLTSRSEEEDRKIGEECGANAYITKPFDTNELLETVHRLLQAS